MEKNYLIVYPNSIYKSWISLEEFLKTEFEAHLNENRNLVLNLSGADKDNIVITEFSFSQDYTQDQAILAFSLSAYFTETMNKLGYKVYRTAEF